jgi:hypothetical protein
MEGRPVPAGSAIDRRDVMSEKVEAAVACFRFVRDAAEILEDVL